MPHLYPHKRHGFQIIYRVWLPDGSVLKKTRYTKKRDIAAKILSDVTRLEALSRQRSLTSEEITYCLNQRYITQEEAQETGGSSVLHGQSWRDLALQYERRSRENCRPYTHACNISKINVVLARLKVDPSSISKADIEEYISGRKREGVSNATINKEIAVIRGLLNIIAPKNNPAREIRLLKLDDERLPRPLYPEEIKALLGAVRENRHLLRGYLEPIVLTYLYAGLRPSELSSLIHADLDLRANKIYVQSKDGFKPKTGRARSVDIHVALKPYLKTLKGHYLFGGEHRFPPRSISQAIRRIIKKIGIRGVTPYSLRHSFVSYLLMAGATLRETMDLAGHSRITTTSRYLHTIPNPDSPVLKLNYSRSSKNRSRGHRK